MKCTHLTLKIMKVSRAKMRGKNVKIIISISGICHIHTIHNTLIMQCFKIGVGKQ